MMRSGTTASLLLLCLLILCPSSTESVPNYNTAPPLQFLQDGYNVTIYENSRPRTYVGSRQLIGVPLSALPTRANLRYSIIKGDSDYFFTVESETIGDVAVLLLRTRTGLNDVLNRERKAKYDLTILGEVRSRHKPFTTVSTSVRVNVLDVNDNIPLFYEYKYTVTVGEDAELQTSLLTVSADDADVGANGKVYYYLKDPSVDLFSVHPMTGLVTVTGRLDYSQRTHYEVVILAEDRGSKRSSQKHSAAAQTTVFVRVKKVNLFSPKIIVNHLPHVVEHSHTHIYAIISVTDKDVGKNGDINSVDIINGDANGIFSISKGNKSNEYNLEVLKLLDRELAPTGYNLTLRAVDNGFPKRESIVNVHVSITDINDQFPVFVKEEYSEAVTEEAPPCTPVVTVAASDLDKGTNGKVQFRILAGNDNGKFTINPHTGLISTKDWLDAEATAYYTLTVAAIDQANNAQRKQSSAKVIIKVLDGNDNTPKFTTPNTEVTIDENEPAGSYVTRVMASDLDSDENGFVYYSIANLDKVLFSIDPFDGTIRTSAVLDYEAERRTYTIQVRASDWGQPLKRETETTVKVKIRDVNDNRPVFVEHLCSGWLDLDAPIGSSIATFKAIDLDQGDKVFYRLEDSDYKGCWALDSTTGVLAVSCELRKIYEKSPKQTVVINLTSTDGTHVSDPATLTLAIIDKTRDAHLIQDNARVACQESSIVQRQIEVEAAARNNNELDETFALFPPRYGHNAHPPEFPPKFPESIEVSEDVEVGYEIIKIDATDHDRGHNGRIVYAVTDGDIDSVFKIDVETGSLVVWASLDKEKTSTYDLNITLYDLGISHKSSSKNLTIHVLDVNDNSPIFTQLSYNLYLPENTRNGTSVLQLTANDPDEGRNGEVSYELITHLKEFTLDTTLGILYVSGKFDREMIDKYDLRVRAWDNAIDTPKSSLARVLVNILDINDCTPDFGAGSELEVDVPEDYPLGAVIATLQAADNDLGTGGQVSYKLISGHEMKFRIDPLTGIVRVASQLDFETRQVYNLSILAVDGGSPSLSSVAHLLIRVMDVEENLGPPYFKNRILRSSILENLSPGSLVSTVEASDADDGKLDYSIVGGSGYGVFSINNKGEVRTLRRLDREAIKGYWLAITVSDDGTVPLSDTCHMYVEVEDVNDNIPQTELPVYRPTISEAAPVGTTVVTLRASDEDLSPSNVTFAVSKSRNRRANWLMATAADEDPLEIFAVNSHTGVIKTTAPLDRERQAEYELWIAVSDSELTSYTPVFVTVTDINDNTPKFLEKVYRFSVPARAKPDKKKPIFRVFAVDPDEGANADLRYSIKTRRGKSRFKIDKSSGQVYTSKGLNQGQSFDVKVKVTDNGHPQLSSSAHVIIHVLDLPTTSVNAPIIEPPTRAHVMESDPSGHVVAFINAFDLDNDTLWYSIVAGDEDKHFSIGMDSGLVTLARPLNHESVDSYELVVGVSDGIAQTRTELTVQVMDSNEHSPVFQHKNYHSTVKESSKPGYPVVTVKCIDRDSSPGTSRTISSTVSYSILHSEMVDSVSFFDLDPTSGQLILALPLDRELSSDHTLTVSCKDRGTLQREDFARIYVTVEDANDHIPIFLENMIEVQVSEGASTGSVVARVRAVDRDEGENGRISYGIVEGNEGGAFAISEDLGHISVAQPLLHRGRQEYLLLVRAMDHAQQPKASSVPVRINLKTSLESPPTWRGADLPRVVEMSEWAPYGTIIAKVSASAPPSLQYRISSGNTDKEVFAITPSSGILSLQMGLDFEENNFYNLTIEATNAVGTSATIWICVRVLDENDWRPEWQRPEYEGAVLETSAIGDPVLISLFGLKPESLTVRATDSDKGKNGRVTYEIVEKGLITRMFTINELTGAVRVADHLEEFAGRTIMFSVWARDGGTPKRECLIPASVRIFIRKVNLSPPAFKSLESSSTLYLPTVPGVKILCASAYDPDNEKESVSFPNSDGYHSSTLRYAISDGNESKHFKIDKHSGCIYVVNSIDLNSRYNLTLEATDGTFKGSSFAEINVKELPLGALKFSQDKYYAHVPENSTAEISLAQVGVKGLPLNSHIRYTLLNPNRFFNIRTTSGILKTTGARIDREKQDHFIFIIKAEERVNVESFGYVTIHVAILDVNDNEPVFVGQPYDALVSTASTRGQVITKVKAVDADSGAFGQVRYELVRGSGELFHVDKRSGEVRLKQTLLTPDKRYSITVAAFDSGNPPLSSQAHLLIRVVAAEGPIFNKALYRASVAENKPLGTPITRLGAKTPFGGEIIFTIVSGNENGNFELEYKTGIFQGGTQCVLRIASALDYERTSGHNLTVRARDPLTGLHSDSRVTVEVKDVNDNQPEFQYRVFEGSVSEASPIGQSVLKLQAFDKDTGAGGIVRYFCTDSCGNFSVEAETGTISVSGPLDAERETQHKMIVTAKDLGLPPLTATASVFITVMDFNDNAPVWTQDTYQSKVSSEAKAGHVVTALFARDPDVSNTDGSHLSYHIQSGDSQSIFSLDSSLGLVTVAAPHQLTAGNYVTLNVSANDGVFVAFTSLRLEILPSNSFSPVFEKPLYEGSVEENGPPGEFIVTVGAWDFDKGEFGTLKYNILGQEKEAMFKVDEEGKLYTDRPLDREERPIYHLILRAKDGGGRMSFTKIRISVKDKNDNAPAFPLSLYQANIPVDTAPGVEILKVSATDADEGANGAVSYYIYEESHSEAMEIFQVDSATGVISMKEEVTGRENEVFQFFIRAKDGGSPEYSSDVPVSIFLMNSHERPPICPRKYAQFFLREDDDIGTVVTSLWKSGPMKVKYSIVVDGGRSPPGVGGETVPPFTISDKGDIVVSRPLDHERMKVHSITVVNETLSTPSMLDYMTVSVVVMDVNDCVPQFTSPTYDAVVAENSDVGSVFAFVSATDRDQGSNGQIQYNFAPSTEDWIRSFVNLDPHSGALALSKPLDREELAGFSFTVVASDGASRSYSAEALVKVVVQDYNDNPPVFEKDSYLTNVPEDTSIGTVIVELALSDEDAESTPLHFFVLSGEPRGHFLVHGSGQVYVARPLDRELQDHYSLILTATDGKFSANTTISVSIIDVNDNGPKCKEHSYERTLPEDAKLGTPLVDVVAWDEDESLNARTRYSLSGAGHDHFSIDQMFGQVTTARQLDRETQDTYSLTVLVEDWSVPEWNCKVGLTVVLTDVNDNPPEFLQKSYSLAIAEDTPVNAVLTKIVAIDSDLGLSKRVEYSLSNSADEHFGIDPSEGIISLLLPLDREMKDSFEVVLQAKDGGTPSFTASASLRVSVTDVNDNAPEFVRTLQQVTLKENEPLGTEISRVMATSKDIGINADISYSIEHPTQEKYLKIHPKTGVISINSLMDYEEVQLIVATIVASDAGDPPLSSTALLNVTLNDVNDNSPVFTQDVYEITVPENDMPGKSLFQVSANDIDSGQNGEISYSLKDGNDHQLFSIEPHSGVIQLAKPLDREEVSLWELVIRATDNGVPQNTASSVIKITVADVNDNPPTFAPGNYSAVVQEDRPLGYAVFRFLVNDKDLDPNGAPFMWEMLGPGPPSASPSNRPFALNQDGTLTLATNKLNHKVKSKYEVAVRVWDNGSPPLSSDTAVSIIVVEESRYPPTLFPLGATVVSHNGPFPGGVVGKLSAIDQDPYDVLKYSINKSKTSREVSEYFNIDEDDGTLVASTPLDSGVYALVVGITDGKFSRSVKTEVRVLIVDDDMVDNSVVVRLGALSPKDFLSRYRKIFLNAVSIQLSKPKKNIVIISVQPAKNRAMKKAVLTDGRREFRRRKKQRRRKRRDVAEDLEILIAVKEKRGYINRESLLKVLKRFSSRIESILSVPFAVIDSVCSDRINCSNHGSCIDVIDMTQKNPVILITQLSSIVAPKFKQVHGCSCDQGFDGDNCEELVNACGHRPCFEFEECIPSEELSRGYTCRCPAGKAGPRCHVDLSKCKEPSCHYPVRPLSFKGKSYAQYSMGRPIESSSLQLSTYIRTKNPVGVVLYASGKIDYNILEISEGRLQYRWDCGSGEGLVKVSNLRVDDGKWHFVNLTRDGTVSVLSVDGKQSSGASPGVHDVFNMESDNLYVGAKVQDYSETAGSLTSVIEFGFVGCVDLLQINSFRLPVTVNSPPPAGIATLKRLANVELRCPEKLAPPGVCGSHPCLNGGTCKESGDTYSCLCYSRFSGNQCQIDTAPCSSSPCLNGGECVVVGHNYKCECPSKISGKRCEYGVHCNPNPCLNGGRCEEGTRGPICKCQQFTGSKCQMDIDECTRSPCQNGGTCLNLYGGFRCLCTENVTGEYCTDSLEGDSPDFIISLKELISIVSVLGAVCFVIMVLVIWQRRKWKSKRHQQNNRVKLTAHHVKNDLKANDVAKRNSKICNVEADQHQQGGPLLLLPSRPSFTPVGGAATADSVLLSTLKQHWADLSSAAAENEGLELHTLSRRLSNEYVHNLKASSGGTSPPTLPSPILGDEVSPYRKPWDHHNNLNETYFTPSKDVGFDLPPNLEESSNPTSSSPQHTSSISDNSSGPSQLKSKGYHYDDYDLRGSTSMLTFGTPGGAKAPSERGDAEGSAEGAPLLDYSENERCLPHPFPMSNGTSSPSSPLLNQRDRTGNVVKTVPCSFDDVLLENNIYDSSHDGPNINSPVSSPYPYKMNIVSDIDDEADHEAKISNLPLIVPPPEYVPDVPKSPVVGDSSLSKLGSPRCRRPFLRQDYGRISDLSFMSNIDEEQDYYSSLERDKLRPDSPQNSYTEIHL